MCNEKGKMVALERISNPEGDLGKSQDEVQELHYYLTREYRRVRELFRLVDKLLDAYATSDSSYAETTQEVDDRYEQVSRQALKISEEWVNDRHHGMNRWVQ